MELKWEGEESRGGDGGGGGGYRWKLLKGRGTVGGTASGFEEKCASSVNL